MVSQQLEALNLGRLVDDVVVAGAVVGRQVAAGGDGKLQVIRCTRISVSQSVSYHCIAFTISGEIETGRRLTYMFLLTAACH